MIKKQTKTYRRTHKNDKRTERTEGLLRSERDKFQGVLSAIGEKMYIVNKNYEIDYQNEILDSCYMGIVLAKNVFVLIYNPTHHAVFVLV